MSDLRPLWELQVLEGQRRALELKLREGQAPAELKALRDEIEAGRTAFNELKERYGFLKKSLKMKEFDAAAAAAQAENLRQKLYSGQITNVKEVSTGNKKLENLLDIVRQTEDEILNIMEELDVLREKLETMSGELNQKAGEYRRLHNSHLAGQQKVRQLLAQIPLARKKLLDEIDSYLWQKYREMKNKYSEPLAKVEKGTCMGCRVAIPFNDLRLLKQGEGLVFCSNCGRMLYWERQF
ncbi:MAG: hypothetical protein HPY89_03430 [Pelotomaculum sp.]|uniref:Zn-ribbon protein, possibly nucleic acid-binding n=1 Tax=Pelotomaculum thermopropionicum (strain DSM 13744 / JCM 10971 / SI) TaxID=370438 RepID=A5D3S3_PELTS|nr:hypothetical protein [Pelotomaculum sp.]BAF59096.1 Zn-ribbon protein, possibly nucleic acid-binding [Pelotomaculum thermopropionicum SI]